jgi:predicted DNA-binding protein (UPF0251 family)
MVKVGQIFGNLVVTEHSPITKRSSNQEDRWYCQCTACGDRVRLHESLLTKGIATSCGAHCGSPTVTRNQCPTGTSHGPDVTEYNTWRRMWLRVYHKTDKDYGYYGFKGITIHPSWKDFDVFLSDVGKKPITYDSGGNLENYSLDRISANSGNIHYEPGNCKWATQKEQNLNKGNCRPLVIYEGKEMTYVEAAKRKGIHRTTLASRIDKHGVDKALSM